MSIVEVGVVEETQHVVVVLKTDDGELHAFEWGKAAAAPGPSHAHHDKAHTDHAPHHGHHGHEVHKDGPAAADDTHAYPARFYSPASTRPGGAPAVPPLKAVGTKDVKPDVLHHDLKHAWHHHHETRKFNDAHTFGAFVLEKLGAV